jgi:lysozyme family protein
MSAARIKQHPKETVELWLKRIFKHEGGFSDNPKDPGNWTGGKVGVGELKGTKFGIAANTYGHLDIKNLTILGASEIYMRDYLAPIHAYEHEDGVAYQLLCFAVQSGPHRAIRSLQKAIGVKDDGVIGPVTLAKLRTYSEARLIMLILAERIIFVAGLPPDWWGNFSKGVMIRMAENLRHGAEDSA